MLELFAKNEDGFDRWYEKDRLLDDSQKILTPEFFDRRFELKSRLENQNYENLGLEYDNKIWNDRQYINEIIKKDLAYASESFLWDFYEEVRSNLDSR